MTAVAHPPAATDPLGGPVAPPAPTAAPSSRRRRPVRRLRQVLRTTSGRYRVWSAAAALAMVVAAVAATTAAVHMRASASRASDNSGPVLVATQQLVSSLAEADAAATAAFLSGRDEDPEQRRLYEQALARGNQQIESIAALVGDDPDVHAALQRIAVQVTRYAGLVEAARVTNKAGGAEAGDFLARSVRLVDDIVQGDVAGLTTATQSRLEDDVAGRGSPVPLAVLVLLGALAVLVAGQLGMTRASRRILNIPLVLATLLVSAALATLVRADRSAAASQAEARREGYDSIALTVRLATAGFGAKASETLALISGSGEDGQAGRAQAGEVATARVTADVAQQIRGGTAAGAPGGLLGAAAAAADSPRERAAVAEAAVRWQRYRDAAAASTDAGSSGAAFNGFNFSVESLLGQNRLQFLSGLDHAASATSNVPVILLLLLAGALLTMFWGFQLRIDDYR